jgi:hypothetical protein
MDEAMLEQTVALKINDWTRWMLERHMARHGVGLDELVAAALAARDDDWYGDDAGELLRQDLLLGRAMQDIKRPAATVEIPSDVLRGVAEKLAVDGGNEAAVASLLSWWNSVKPDSLPLATAFDVFGAREREGYSYTVDCPDHRRPESFEGMAGTARSSGIYVEFRFHRISASDGYLTVYNMDGSSIEGCKAPYGQYVWWMAGALKRAFEVEWKEFVPEGT